MLSHVNKKGLPAMVDVSEKKVTTRVAKAQTKIFLPDEVVSQVNDGEIFVAKGAVFQTAIIAGTMAVKKTADLIPFCHPLGIESCCIEIKFIDSHHIIIESCVQVSGKTGVEMEALVGSSLAALTVYDMCKALSHDIVIQETQLIFKSGGKSDLKT